MVYTQKLIVLTGCALALGAPCMAASCPSPTRFAACEHWQAIAQGNISSVMEGYQPDAQLHWKNGGLKGDYTGQAAIRSIWAQFTRTRTPLTYTARNIHETMTGKDGAIVTADVTFRNDDWSYTLDYRLVFQGGKIAEETWKRADYDIEPGAI